MIAVDEKKLNIYKLTLTKLYQEKYRPMSNWNYDVEDGCVRESVSTLYVKVKKLQVELGLTKEETKKIKQEIKKRLGIKIYK